MPLEAIEGEIRDAYLRLAGSAAVARHRQRHYLDGQTAGTLFGTVTALTAAHPWALEDFGAAAWAAYQPDPRAPAPDGLRVGILRAGEGLPPTPAVARFAGHGHLLISESGFADGAPVAAAGAYPAAGHGDQAGFCAVRAGRSGGAGPPPERVPAAARADAGGQRRGRRRGQPGRGRGPAGHADQPCGGGHPDPADQRLRLGGGLQRGHHRGYRPLPRPGPGRLPGGHQRPGRGVARPAGPQRPQERPVHRGHAGSPAADAA